MKKLIFLAAVCGVLISCGSTKVSQETQGEEVQAQAATALNPVYVTNKARFTLLATAFVEKKIDAVQHITAQFGKRSFESDCLLIADAEKLSMTMLNDFGTTMGELNYNNSLVVFDSELFPRGMFDAEYIVADVQFCLYQAAAVRTALEAIGLRFEVAVEKGADGKPVETRRIFDGEKEIIYIEKTAEKIAYTNVLRGYSYVLQGAF